MRKYLIIAGVSWFDWENDKRGRNESKLSSRPIQIKNHELEEMESMVPRIKVVINKDAVGKRRNIKLGKEFNLSK
jgi:hypothetical protein